MNDDLRKLINTIESINKIDEAIDSNIEDKVDNLTDILMNGGYGFSDITNRIESLAFKLKNRGIESEVINRAVNNYLSFVASHLDDLIQGRKFLSNTAK